VVSPAQTDDVTSQQDLRRRALLRLYTGFTSTYSN